jgi:hypothetical protein
MNAENKDGRGSVLERTARADGSTCAWCGQPAKFSYWAMRESPTGFRSRPLLGEPMGQGKPFCSIGCFEVYSSS